MDATRFDEGQTTVTDTMRTIGRRTVVRVAAAGLLAVIARAGTLGAVSAERKYFPAQGDQNGFVKACREAGAAPKRERSRVVSCTKLDNDGSAERITCNFKTNKCWRARTEPPTGGDHGVTPPRDDWEADPDPNDGGSEPPILL